MKKAISILILSAVLFSCKKESTITENDFQLNASLDKQLSARYVVNMQKDEVYSLALKKQETLFRILKNNPNIDLLSLYPANNTASRDGDCLTEYTSAINGCDRTFYVGVAVSCIWALATSFVATPVAGAGALTVGVGKDTYNHLQCALAAMQAKNDCLTKK